MADAAGRLWISQADSDLWAADRVYDPAEPRSYCQAISKCQQVVEKSVKAIAAGVRDRLLMKIDVGYGHDVSWMASLLRRAAPAGDPTDVQHRIHRLLSAFTIGEIKASKPWTRSVPPRVACTGATPNTLTNAWPGTGRRPPWRGSGPPTWNARGRWPAVCLGTRA